MEYGTRTTVRFEYDNALNLDLRLKEHKNPELNSDVKEHLNLANAIAEVYHIGAIL